MISGDEKPVSVSWPEKAVRGGHITVKERASILKTFEDGMNGYTYYEKD